MVDFSILSKIFVPLPLTITENNRGHRNNVRARNYGKIPTSEIVTAIIIRNKTITTRLEWVFDLRIDITTALGMQRLSLLGLVLIPNYRRFRFRISCVHTVDSIRLQWIISMQ